MLIPVKYVENMTEEEIRACNDLIYNANSHEYCNERGFKQKLIDNLYKLGYYKDNETIFVNRTEK